MEGGKEEGEGKEGKGKEEEGGGWEERGKAQILGAGAVPA